MYKQKPRKAECLIGINGVNVWGDIKRYGNEIVYTDVATGKTDSFDVSIHDVDEHFMTDWLVDKGTRINGAIVMKNWEKEDDEKIVDFGEFLVDSVRMKGFPYEVTIKSLALPVQGTKNTKKWEDISLCAIAEDICGWLGVELKWYADDITVKSQSQNRETDISFLFSLCKEYGLGMRVYKNSIIVFSREEQDAAPAVSTYDIKKIADRFELADNEEGTYTGARSTYKLDGDDTEYEYSCGGSERVLVLSTSSSSLKEAELKTKAALYDANAEAVILTFRALGGLPVYANNNYEFTGLGAYSGKYAIEQVEHTLSGESIYTIEVTAHLVNANNKKGNIENEAE